jgi:hypothetical protein
METAGIEIVFPAPNEDPSSSPRRGACPCSETSIARPASLSLTEERNYQMSRDSVGNAKLALRDDGICRVMDQLRKSTASMPAKIIADHSTASRRSSGLLRFLCGNLLGSKGMAPEYPTDDTF